MCLHLKTKLKSRKANHYFKDSRQKRIALSCSKEISAILRERASKDDRDFYCLDYFHSFRRKSKSHKNVCENKYFFGGCKVF